MVLKRGFNALSIRSPDELAGLAMESEIDSRLVSHQDAALGQPWPAFSYDHLGENNWSLLVQAVNHGTNPPP